MNKNLKRNIFITLFGFVLPLLILSCGNRRHEIKDVKVKKKSDRVLKNALFEQDEISYDFFTVRIGVDFESKKQNASFSCYVKMKVDSAFGGSIKAGPIVAGTYLITQDSIIYANKRKKCYFAENLNYISSLFGTTIEYDFFQDLILGLPIGLDEETKYQQIFEKDQDHYILSSHKKRDFRKLEHDRLDLEENLMLIQYHMDPTTFAVYKTDIEIPEDTTSITVNYLERKLEDDISVPEETTLLIVNPTDSIYIRLNYGSVKLNEPKEIKIKIPDSYVECP